MTNSVWLIENRSTNGGHDWLLWSPHSEPREYVAQEWAERLNSKPHLYPNQEFRAVEYVRAPTAGGES